MPLEPAAVAEIAARHLEAGRSRLLEALGASDPATSLAHAELAMRAADAVGNLRRLDPYAPGSGHFESRDALGEPGAAERIRLHRALANVTTTNVPNLTTPVPLGTPTGFDPDLAAPFLATWGIPVTTGETFTGPVWNIPTAAEQTTQKTEIASGTITITGELASMRTWGFGADVSIQVFSTLGDPTYLAFLENLMRSAANTAAEAAILTDMTTGLTPTTTDRAGLVDAVIGAMAGVAAAVGLGPATVIVGGLVAGGITAYELGRSNVAGLPPVVVTAGLPDNRVVVAHRFAFAAPAVPVGFMQVPRPRVGGVDVAAYRIAGYLELHPGGVAVIDLTTT
jgi:hypothetical protein